MIKEKKCGGPCGEIKPVSKFSIYKRSKSGFQSKCKRCTSQYNKENIKKSRIKRVQYEKDNPDVVIKAKENIAKWHKDNPDYRKRYYQDNKYEISIRMSKYCQDNADTARARGVQWRKDNPEKVLFNSSKHRAMKLQRTVAWADIDKIKDIYDQCAEINLAAKTAGCTEKFAVDHVIPLQGKLVSGLHVEGNLDIITVGDNCRKSNKFIPG